MPSSGCHSFDHGNSDEDDSERELEGYAKKKPQNSKKDSDVFHVSLQESISEITQVRFVTSPF